MAWPILKFSKSQVNKAGKILAGNKIFDTDLMWAIDVVDNWRSCHGYPINTFQATLRHKLKGIDNNAIVAQRLKRMFSIVGKLRRIENMQLSRMQDIGGLRAVVSSLSKVRLLEKDYQTSRFNHDLVASYDYINNPKRSGYRGIHHVYRYKNFRVPKYNGLLIELQIRTELQHAWATAVETMGTFLNHALKSSEGPEIWLDFFSLTGSAFAHLEKTQPVPGYEEFSPTDTFRAVLDQVEQLQVKDRLQAFSIAAKKIHIDKKPGSYHLVILNTVEKSVEIRTYSASDLSVAGKHYTEIESRIAEGAHLQAVLVSAGNIENLRRAYPNYFLDTFKFIQQINRIEKTYKSLTKAST